MTVAADGAQITCDRSAPCHAHGRIETGETNKTHKSEGRHCSEEGGSGVATMPTESLRVEYWHKSKADSCAPPSTPTRPGSENVSKLEYARNVSKSQPACPLCRVPSNGGMNNFNCCKSDFGMVILSKQLKTTRFLFSVATTIARYITPARSDHAVHTGTRVIISQLFSIQKPIAMSARATLAACITMTTKAVLQTHCFIILTLLLLPNGPY
jgi:hypothetical protein